MHRLSSPKFNKPLVMSPSFSFHFPNEPFDEQIIRWGFFKSHGRVPSPLILNLQSTCGSRRSFPHHGNSCSKRQNRNWWWMPENEQHSPAAALNLVILMNVKWLERGQKLLPEGLRNTGASKMYCKQQWSSLAMVIMDGPLPQCAMEHMLREATLIGKVTAHWISHKRAPLWSRHRGNSSLTAFQVWGRLKEHLPRDI